MGSAPAVVPAVAPYPEVGAPGIAEELLAGAVKLVGVAAYFEAADGVVLERAARPLAAGVLVLVGGGVCVDGFGGYWAFESFAAVLPAKGFVFQNARLLLPPDWQPARPNIAITANANCARWIPMAEVSFWKPDIEKGREEPPYDLRVEWM